MHTMHTVHKPRPHNDLRVHSKIRRAYTTAIHTETAILAVGLPFWQYAHMAPNRTYDIPLTYVNPWHTRGYTDKNRKSLRRNSLSRNLLFDDSRRIFQASPGGSHTAHQANRIGELGGNPMGGHVRQGDSSPTGDIMSID